MPDKKGGSIVDTSTTTSSTLDRRLFLKGDLAVLGSTVFIAPIAAIRWNYSLRSCTTVLNEATRARRFLTMAFRQNMKNMCYAFRQQIVW